MPFGSQWAEDRNKKREEWEENALTGQDLREGRPKGAGIRKLPRSSGLEHNCEARRISGKDAGPTPGFQG